MSSIPAGRLFAWLGAPTAWITNLMVVYGLQASLCHVGVDPDTVRVVLVGLSVVFGLVAVAAGVTAWRVGRRDDREPVRTRAGSGRDGLPVVGVLLAVVFVLAIVLTGAVPMATDTC